MRCRSLGTLLRGHEVRIAAISASLALTSAPLASPTPPRARTAARVAQSTRVDTGRVQVPGGSLYYEAAGHGPVVVFLHSGNLDGRTWDPQFLSFARSFRVIRYDARGLG